MKILPYFFPLILLLFVFSGCNDEEITATKNGFTRIYNKQELNKSYYPLSIQQSQDSGYIVLSRQSISDANFFGVHVMKTDKDGHFLWEKSMELPYVNPVPQLIEQDSSFYFFCMDNTSLGTYLIKINETDQTLTEANQYNDLTYPLAANVDANGRFILQNFLRLQRKTALTRFNENLDIEWMHDDYDVLTDAEPSIIGHLTNPESRLPFFVGASPEGNYYYMNGFREFTLTLMFVSANGSETGNAGIVNGFQDEAAVSSLVPWSGQQFLLTRFAQGENYILADKQLNVPSPDFVGMTGEFGGNLMPEWERDAGVHSRKITIDEENYIVVATTTKSRQIQLMFYSADSKALEGIKNLGRNNPFRISDITLTFNGGIAVTGIHQVAGRYPRISLFHITKGELSDIVK